MTDRTIACPLHEPPQHRPAFAAPSFEVVPEPPAGPPAWDRVGELRAAGTTSTSPVLVVLAVVAGLVAVAAVGWLVLRGPSADQAAAGGPSTTLTQVATPALPIAGQAKQLDDGWLQYRSPDGQWLFDTPVVPSSPLPLPSTSTVLMTYGPTDFGRVGFGWSQGQLAPASDERAVLVTLMKGIALSRGVQGLEPTVLDTDRGPVVTAEMQLTGGSALFVLRSVDRRPIVAMVIADLGAPDPAVANRMLDSFRPAG